MGKPCPKCSTISNRDANFCSECGWAFTQRLLWWCLKIDPPPPPSALITLSWRELPNVKQRRIRMMRRLGMKPLGSERLFGR